MIAFLAAFVPASSVPAAAQTGTFVVSGRVTERGQDRGIAGASVQLGEEYRAVTDSAGRFEIRNVRPDRYPLTVQAFGYETAQTTITVFEDTQGTVQLDPQPVALDTLAIQPALFDLRGRLVDAATGRLVPYATIRIATAVTSSNDAGTFRIRDLARGQHAVRIEGFGWMPFREMVDLDSDTMITFELERDPITAKIIATQIERLSARSRSTGHPRRTIGRDDILDSRAGTPVEILSSNGGVRIRDCIHREASERQLNVPMSSISVCIVSGYSSTPVRPVVFIDDRQVCGLEFLNAYTNALLEHIEVMRNGLVIRAYTSDFIQNMAARRITLQPMTDFHTPRTC